MASAGPARHAVAIAIAVVCDILAVMVMTFGELIRNRREKRRLTQGQLGELVGVNQATVSTWEKDVSRPSGDNLKAVRRELGISVDEWLATTISDDPVIQAIWGQTKLTQEVRQALVRIYEQVVKASVGGSHAMPIDNG